VSSPVKPFVQFLHGSSSQLPSISSTFQENIISVSTPTRLSTRQLVLNTPPSILKSSLVSTQQTRTKGLNAVSHNPKIDVVPAGAESGRADVDDIFGPSVQTIGDDWVDEEDVSDGGGTDGYAGIPAPRHRKALSRHDPVHDEDGSGADDSIRHGKTSLPQGPGGQGGRFSAAQLEEVERHAATFKAEIARLAQSWGCHPSTLYRIAGVSGTLAKHRGPNAWNSFQHQQKLANRNPSGLGMVIYLNVNFIV
jgi:hypothetical protein